MAMSESNAQGKSQRGIDYAAIFMLSIGVEESAMLMRGLSNREVQRLSAAIARNRKIVRESLESVMQDFVDRLRHQTSVGAHADSYLREVLAKALGAERASEVLDRVVTGGEYAGLEIARWADPKSLAEILRGEHPQIIATILANLEPERAGDVLHNMPERLVPDVVYRMATLSAVPPNAVRELNEVLDQQLSGQISGMGGGLVTEAGGPKAAAEAINRLEASRSKHILDHIAGIDPLLAQKIEDSMFTFADLASLDDRSLQVMLREVDRGILASALKGASDELRERVFHNLTERGVEMLKDELASKGPMRLSEVETAQREILKLAQRLDSEGQIVLGAKGEDRIIE